MPAATDFSGSSGAGGLSTGTICGASTPKIMVDKHPPVGFSTTASSQRANSVILGKEEEGDEQEERFT